MFSYAKSLFWWRGTATTVAIENNEEKSAHDSLLNDFDLVSSQGTGEEAKDKQQQQQEEKQQQQQQQQQQQAKKEEKEEEIKKEETKVEVQEKQEEKKENLVKFQEKKNDDKNEVKKVETVKKERRALDDVIDQLKESSLFAKFGLECETGKIGPYRFLRALTILIDLVLQALDAVEESPSHENLNVLTIRWQRLTDFATTNIDLLDGFSRLREYLTSLAGVTFRVSNGKVAPDIFARKYLAVRRDSEVDSFLKKDVRRQEEEVAIIYSYLEETGNAHGKNRKAELASSLMAFIVNHRYTLDHYPRFYKTVHKKLMEIINDNDGSIRKTFISYYIPLFGNDEYAKTLKQQ